MARVAKIDLLGMIGTAPGEDRDSVSRVFAAGAEAPGDPIAGSAHCTRIPYSTDYFSIGGDAAIYLRGMITL